MKITFLGGGNMANALIGGLLKQGFPVADIRVVEPLAENRERLAGAFGIACRPATDAATLDSNVLVLSVKPQQMRRRWRPVGKLTSQLVIALLPACG
jgi:pyrroline-5-carboxylate reductase